MCLAPGTRLRDEFTAYVPSRPQLEWQIRQRVYKIPNVEIHHRSVAEPRFDVDSQRVTGVYLDSDGDEPEYVSADVVVDAAGRGTRLPVWLEQWGYQRPPEKTVEVGIGYASHQFRLPEGAVRERVIVAGASVQQPLGLGLLGYEDGTWTLTTFGVAKVEPPRTFPEMLALAKEILPERISSALDHAEPVGEPAFHRYPTSRWRRYHKLDRFPAGIVPLGDAVASFDPTYGQGMTMSSLQASHLRRALADNVGDDLARVVNKATAKSTYPVWTMTAIGDISLHNATGEAPWWYRPVGSLFDQFLGAAETDPVLAEWFLRRFSLLDSLYMVPSVGPCRPHRSAQHATVAGRASAPERRSWSQADGSPEDFRRLVGDQSDRSVVGRHPRGGAAGQRQLSGLSVYCRRTLDAHQDLRTVVP